MKRFEENKIPSPVVCKNTKNPPGFSFRRAAGLGLFLFLICFPAFADTASWYSTEACKYNPTKGCPTASGMSLFQLEDRHIDFAAMWGVPFNTKIKVTNLSNNKSVVVTVLDRGPAKRLNRVIDLSKSAFQKIADTRKGLINVKVEVMK